MAATGAASEARAPGRVPGSHPTSEQKTPGVAPGAFRNAMSVRAGPAYLAMSFRPLSGRTLMTLRAGLALKTVSSLVKGLIPLRALVAGLWTTLIFTRPGTANTPGPFLPTAPLISRARASNTALTCLRDRAVFSAIAVMISLFEGLLAAMGHSPRRKVGSVYIPSPTRGRDVAEHRQNPRGNLMLLEKSSGKTAQSACRVVRVT